MERSLRKQDQRNAVRLAVGRVVTIGRVPERLSRSSGDERMCAAPYRVPVGEFWRDCLRGRVV